MNFTIYFKDVSVLTINGIQRTFNKDTKYGFIDIDKKEIDKIRKTCLKNSNMIFTETSDFTGCVDVIRKITTSKDITVDSLITLNKGKKNKNSKNLVSKSIKDKNRNIEEQEELIKETSEDIEKSEEIDQNGLTNLENSNIIELGDEVNE